MSNVPSGYTQPLPNAGALAPAPTGTLQSQAPSSAPPPGAQPPVSTGPAGAVLAPPPSDTRVAGPGLQPAPGASAPGAQPLSGAGVPGAQPNGGPTGYDAQTEIPQFVKQFLPPVVTDGAQPGALFNPDEWFRGTSWGPQGPPPNAPYPPSGAPSPPGAYYPAPTQYGQPPYAPPFPPALPLDFPPFVPPARTPSRRDCCAMQGYRTMRQCCAQQAQPRQKSGKSRLPDAPAPAPRQKGKDVDQVAQRARARGIHVVRAGETLSSIAARHGLSWRQVYWCNRAKIAHPDVIEIGQRLRIPAKGYAVPDFEYRPLRSAPVQRSPKQRVTPRSKAVVDEPRDKEATQVPVKPKRVKPKQAESAPRTKPKAVPKQGKGDATQSPASPPPTPPTQPPSGPTTPTPAPSAPAPPTPAPPTGTAPPVLQPPANAPMPAPPPPVIQDHPNELPPPLPAGF